MGGHEARAYWEDVGLMMLIGGFFLAPFAWFLDLQVSYAMNKWACENDARTLLLLVPLGSLALVALGTWMSWSCWMRLRHVAIEEGPHMEDRSYFVAIAGLVMNATFALLILVSIVPRYVLNPCE